MHRVVPVLLILIAIAIAASLAWLFLASTIPGGRGAIATERRTVAPFTRLAIEGYAEATLIRGDSESVTVEAPQKQLAQLRTEVAGGTLTIGSGQARRWWSDLFGGGARPARVTVTYRDLEAISANGAAKIRADRLKADRLDVTAAGATSLRFADLDTRELSVRGSGAMKAELSGRTAGQEIAISGAGDYRALDLASDDARITVSGAGRVAVHAERTLAIGITGAGSVEYTGNPKVTQQISGAGKVRRRDASDGGIAIATALPAIR